jgi:hypothetical protein
MGPGGFDHGPDEDEKRALAILLLVTNIITATGG